MQRDLESWKSKYLTVEVKLKEYDLIRAKLAQLEKDYNGVIEENQTIREEMDVIIQEYKKIEGQYKQLQITVTTQETKIRNSAETTGLRAQIKQLEG